MKRPILNQIPIPTFKQGESSLSVTMSPNQWDNLLKAFYEKGHTLLEIEVVNGKEKVTKAFKNNSLN